MEQTPLRRTPLETDDLVDSWFGHLDVETVRLHVEEQSRALDAIDETAELDDPWFQ